VKLGRVYRVGIANPRLRNLRSRFYPVWVLRRDLANSLVRVFLRLSMAPSRSRGWINNALTQNFRSPVKKTGDAFLAKLTMTIEYTGPP
jgi:hypothetical protein